MLILCSFSFILFGNEAIKQVRYNPMETHKVEKMCLKYLFKKSEDWRLIKRNILCKGLTPAHWIPKCSFLCCVLFSNSLMSVNQEITSEAKIPFGKNSSYRNSRDEGILKNRRCKNKEKSTDFHLYFCNSSSSIPY